MIKTPISLNMLQDTHLPSPADTDVVYYDSTTGLWKSMTVKEMVVGDPAWRYVYNTAGECWYFENSTHEVASRVSPADAGTNRHISQGMKVVGGRLYINTV